MKLADQLVQSLSAPFKPEQYKDEFQEQLSALIESKLKGKAVTPPTKSLKKAPVIDMMEALKRSLAQDAARGRLRTASAPGPTRARKKAS